jgi:hypothetical protein
MTTILIFLSNKVIVFCPVFILNLAQSVHPCFAALTLCEAAPLAVTEGATASISRRLALRDRF